MIVDLALFIVLIGVRAAHGNRHVRGRLLASAVAVAAYILIDAALVYAPLSAAVVVQFTLALPVLLAFATINSAVALVINPWRADRLPERFPTIVQDTIVIALFALTVTLILQEKIFTTTAVGAVVVGLALQDTLGNFFAGLAIQIEKPFRVGQWVNIGGKDGLVTEVTWRATKIRTKLGNFVVVPNNVVAKETITNYSEPTNETRIEVDVDASYDALPNAVKATILAAIKDEPLILKTHVPEVLVWNFAASSITYRIRVWTHDFASDDIIREHLRSAVYYAFRRAGITIPYPTQVHLTRDDVHATPADPALPQRALAAVPIFATLTDDQKAAIARTARMHLYAAGEPIVRQGDPGSSMFVVARGGVRVTVDGSTRELAHLTSGDFFGEMSLLTGEPRNATVIATMDSQLVEITSDDFRHFVMENPLAVDEITGAVRSRAAMLEQHRAAGASAAAAGDTPQSFVARVRRFLRLATN